MGDDTAVEAAHQWVRNRCTLCGMRRTETWVLDEEGRPVVALAWIDRRGIVVRVIEFPWMRGTAPPVPPTSTLSEVFPGVVVGREPVCRPVTP